MSNANQDLSDADLREELIDFVVDMMAQRFLKGQMKRALRKICGAKKISQSVYETLFREARELLNERYKRTRTERLQESYDFYEKIIRDDTVEEKVRIKAQERLDSLGGFDARFKQHDNEDPEDIAAKIRAATLEADSLSVEEEAKP